MQLTRRSVAWIGVVLLAVAAAGIIWALLTLLPDLVPTRPRVPVGFGNTEIDTGSIRGEPGSAAEQVVNALRDDPQVFGEEGFDTALVSDETLVGGTGACYIVRLRPQGAKYLVSVERRDVEWKVTAIGVATENGAWRQIHTAGGGLTRCVDALGHP